MTGLVRAHFLGTGRLELEEANGGGKPFQGRRNRCQDGNTQRPMWRVSQGTEENAGDAGLAQVVKGWKWLHEQAMCKESGQNKASLVCRNKTEVLPNSSVTRVKVTAWIFHRI